LAGRWLLLRAGAGYRLVSAYTFADFNGARAIRLFVLTNKKTDIKYRNHQDWVDAQANLPSQARWQLARG
jgi:hypothetical protein